MDFRSLLSISLFPANMGLALLGAWWASQAGIGAPIIIICVTASTAAIIFLTERIHPAHADWQGDHGDLRTDIAHTIVSQITLPELLRIGLLVLFAGAAEALDSGVGGTLWPHTWPVFLQLCLAMCVSGFGEYWAHRMMHRVPLLWRFHATHHSPDRLYFLNASRFHPIDAGILYILFFVPILVLGVDPQIVMLQTIWIAVHGLYQHCNIQLYLGPLNWVFSMAELHRWHHSLTPEEANRNFGNNILIWDIVFGTVYWPRNRAASATVGLHDMPNFPTSWWGQLLSPWRWNDAHRTSETPQNKA
jgi:sterol desaturase/sphingolipid hydroxylase (fatty acid hydroxylase superfamily)